MSAHATVTVVVFSFMHTLSSVYVLGIRMGKTKLVRVSVSTVFTTVFAYARQEYMYGINKRG